MLGRVVEVPEEQQIPARVLDAALHHTGMTAKALADAIGVAPETVSRWRRGIIVLPRSRWIAAASAMGLDAEWAPPKGKLPKNRGRGRPRGAGTGKG